MYIYDIQQYIDKHRHPGFVLCICDTQSGVYWTVECDINDIPAVIRYFIETEHTVISSIRTHHKAKQYFVSVPFTNGYIRPGRYTYDRNANQLI